MLTRATAYAVKAICRIARANGTRVTAKEIAKDCGIPDSFIVKVLQACSRAGLVRATRGPGGGYLLASSPENTTLLDIVEAVDGPVRIGTDIDSQAREAFGLATAKVRGLLRGWSVELLGGEGE